MKLTVAGAGGRNGCQLPAIGLVQVGKSCCLGPALKRLRDSFSLFILVFQELLPPALGPCSPSHLSLPPRQQQPLHFEKNVWGCLWPVSPWPLEYFRQVTPLPCSGGVSPRTWTPCGVPGVCSSCEEQTLTSSSLRNCLFFKSYSLTRLWGGVVAG